MAVVQQISEPARRVEEKNAPGDDPRRTISA